MADHDDDFPALLKRLRTSADGDLTQEQLGLGITPTVSDATISNWENGKTAPSREHAQALADYFGEPLLLKLAGYGPAGPSLRDLVEKQAEELAELRQLLLDLQSRLPRD